VKVLDFGIASSDLHGGGPGQQRAAGKLWHLAPEQLRPGDKLDRRTDIYALGVLLWELLTQRPVGTIRDHGRETRLPETEGEILMWISRSEHQPPSIFNSEVPPELDALVKQATNVLPENRFANADELRRALAVFIPPEVHPELWLSLAMKEIFAPEQERAERRQWVEAARHLLDAYTGPERRAARSETLPKAVAVRPADFVRERLRWIAPIAVGGLVGLCVLLWLLLTAERRKQSAVAVPAGEGASRSSPALAASPAQAPGPALPRAPQKAPAPAAAPLPSGASQASVDAGHVSKRQEVAVEVPAPVVKTDHLGLARDAFNARDWARALEEGKRAVTAGGSAEAHALVGNTYFKMGRFAEAEQEYMKAIALEPANKLLRDRLSIAHARAQDSRNRKEP